MVASLQTLQSIQTLNCSVAGTARASLCACKANFYGENCTQTIEDDIAPGFCRDFHRAAIAGLGTTYISALSALALFCSFVYILHQNNKNMRLAITGDKKSKVITISWYTKLLDAAVIWSIAWCVYKFFSVGGTDGASQNWHYAATALVRAYSAGLEVFTFGLLAMNGVGKRNFQLAGLAAVLAGLANVAIQVTSAVSSAERPGAVFERLDYLRIGMVRKLGFMEGAIAVGITATTWFVSRRNVHEQAEERKALYPLAVFLAVNNAADALGYLLMVRQVDLGLCIVDLFNFEYYALFAPVLFWVIRTDSEYWTDPDGSDVVQLMYAWNYDRQGADRQGGWDGGLWADAPGYRGSEEIGSGYNSGESSPRTPHATLCSACGAEGTLGYGGGSPGGGSPGGYLTASQSSFSPRTSGGFNNRPKAKQVDNKRLVFVRQLSSGASGSVDEYRYDGKTVAVKTLTKARLKKQDIKEFKKEAGVSCALSHPNVVRTHGVYINPPKLGIVMEFCDRGDLFDCLEALTIKRQKYGVERQPGSGAALATRAGRTLSADGRDGGGGLHHAQASARRETDLTCPFDPMTLALEVASAMEYMQGHVGVAHRDLKSLNVVLCKVGPPKPKKKNPPPPKRREGAPASAAGTPTVPEGEEEEDESKGRASAPAGGAKNRGRLVTNARGTRLTNPEGEGGALAAANRPALTVHTPTAAASVGGGGGGGGSAAAASERTLAAQSAANKRLTHYRAKLADFGDALVTDAITQSELHVDKARLHGTPAWAAPEALLRGSSPGEALAAELGKLPAMQADVYSYGVLLWELITWQQPHLLVPVRLVVEVAEEQAAERRRCRAARVHGVVEDIPAGRAAHGSKKSSAAAAAAAARPLLSDSYAPAGGGGLGPGIQVNPAMSQQQHPRRPVLPDPEEDACVPREGEHAMQIDLQDAEVATAWVARRGARPPMPVGMPPALERLLRDCWKTKPQERPTFEEIKQRFTVRWLCCLPRIPLAPAPPYSCTHPCMPPLLAHCFWYAYAWLCVISARGDLYQPRAVPLPHPLCPAPTAAG